MIWRATWRLGFVAKMTVGELCSENFSKLMAMSLYLRKTEITIPPDYLGDIHVNRRLDAYAVASRCNFRNAWYECLHSRAPNVVVLTQTKHIQALWTRRLVHYTAHQSSFWITYLNRSLEARYRGKSLCATRTKVYIQFSQWSIFEVKVRSFKSRIWLGRRFCDTCEIKVSYFRITFAKGR
jgi:hypothetical protein